MEGKTIRVAVSEVVTRQAELVIGKDITKEEAVELLKISEQKNSVDYREHRALLRKYDEDCGCERGSVEYNLINKHLVSNSTDCNDIDEEDSQSFTSIDITLEE